MGRRTETGRGSAGVGRICKGGSLMGEGSVVVMVESETTRCLARAGPPFGGARQRGRVGSGAGSEGSGAGVLLWLRCFSFLLFFFFLSAADVFLARSVTAAALLRAMRRHAACCCCAWQGGRAGLQLPLLLRMLRQDAAAADGAALAFYRGSVAARANRTGAGTWLLSCGGSNNEHR